MFLQVNKWQWKFPRLLAHKWAAQPKKHLSTWLKYVLSCGQVLEENCVSGHYSRYFQTTQIVKGRPVQVALTIISMNCLYSPTYCFWLNPSSQFCLHLRVLRGEALWLPDKLNALLRIRLGDSVSEPTPGNCSMETRLRTSFSCNKNMIVSFVVTREMACVQMKIIK